MNCYDVGWTAGIVDGEGCLFMARKRRKGKFYYSPRITVGQADRNLAVLVKLRSLWGGCVTFQGRDAWSWSIDNRRALAVLKEILPYLTIKKAQAIVLLGSPNEPDHEGLWLRMKAMKRVI